MSSTPQSSGLMRAPGFLGRRSIQVAVVLGGCLFTYLIEAILEMEMRYAVAAILGLIFLVFALMFVRWLPDLLLYFMVLSIPVLTFDKAFMPSDDYVEFGTPAITLGLMDIFLFGLLAI